MKKASISFLLILTLGIISCGVYRKTSVVSPLDISGANNRSAGRAVYTIADPSLDIPGAKYVKMIMCAPCHEEHFKSFESTSHARISMKELEKEGMGCGMCHGPGSLHIENEFEPGLIINPRKNPEACFRCHLDKKAEFRLQYHHPVLEGRVSCPDCHNVHGTESRPWSLTSFSDTNEVCFKCHPEQRGPFVFVHQPMREGCTICHMVHGSVNDKLLLARDSNVCLQCHFQTQTDPDRFLIGDSDHDSRLPRGTCFNAECHTAVHGSNFDDHLRY